MENNRQWDYLFNIPKSYEIKGIFLTKNTAFFYVVIYKLKKIFFSNATKCISLTMVFGTRRAIFLDIRKL